MASARKTSDDGGLVRGAGKVRCPNCEDEGDILVAFMVLSRNPKYEDDLNVVYKHKACGHVFSLGDPKIMQAYLEGKLVPRDQFITHEDAVRLTREITELRRELSLLREERRVVSNGA